MVAKKTTKAEYLPIEEMLSAETALLQAASALDVAAQFAVECRDIERLIEISTVWLEMSNRLVQGPGSEEPEIEEHEVESIKQPIGFGITGGNNDSVEGE